MNLKHITLALVAVAFSAGLNAQSTPTSTSSAGMTDQQMQERLDRTAAASDRTAAELGLNADQAARMKEIDLRYSRQMIEARNAATDRNVLYQQETALRGQHETEIRTVLNDQQFSRWKASQTSGQKTVKAQTLQESKGTVNE